jgi:hypothetical protein
VFLFVSIEPSAVVQLYGGRHIQEMSEHSWRLITLLIFFAILVPFGFGVDWLFDQVLPREATYFVAGLGICILISQIALRWSERQRN